MYRRLLWRALLFYPILFCVALILFFLKESAVGDPVLTICGSGDKVIMDKRTYENCVKNNNLDKPVFYIDIAPAFIPKAELRKVFQKYKRQSLESLLRNCGSWELVQNLEEEMTEVLKWTPDTSPDLIIALKDFQNRYDKIQSPDELSFLLDDMAKVLPESNLSTARAFQKEMLRLKPSFASFMPKISLNGWENRFHYWWKDAIRLNFGSSYSGRSVNALIGSSLKYTLGLNLVSFCFAFLIGLGFVLLAYFFENKVRWIHTLTSFLFAIPRFWLATILIFLFANKALFPDLAIFSLGGFVSKALPKGGFAVIAHILEYLFLPVLCLSLGTGIFIFKHLQDKIIEEKSSLYVMAAHSRGLSKSKIFFRYILPNGINPLLTIIGSMFVGLLGGSVIIETIFSLPGLGGILFSSYQSNDWPVLFAFCFIGAIMTLLGYILTDLLYLFFDPKLRLEGKNSAS